MLNEVGVTSAYSVQSLAMHLFPWSVTNILQNDLLTKQSLSTTGVEIEAQSKWVHTQVRPFITQFPSLEYLH